MTSDNGIGSHDTVALQLYHCEAYAYNAYQYNVRYFSALRLLLYCYDIVGHHLRVQTRGVPLESIGLLFEGNIIHGAIRDTMLDAQGRSS